MVIQETTLDNYGFNFLPAELLPEGKDEYWQRNLRWGREKEAFRPLSAAEIKILEKNLNRCEDWKQVLVLDPFDATLISNTRFYGLVRIGRLEARALRHHDFHIPVGIRDSVIIACDIGDNCAIQNVAYMAHYVLGKNVILSCIDEMHCTNHAKFGNGIVTPGENEDVRVWMDVMNEAGGRSILPFRDMTTGDAWLWASNRDDYALVNKLTEITQRHYCCGRGCYGSVGDGSVIKSTRICKDVEIGSAAYIKGANKLKNLTVLSSSEEPTQIGEGVELVNGIVGYGCRIFYGCKAVRFVMGRNSSLKYGARLIHSVLGDNSTVSCCELLNNLIFPAHEQHHNNSFLIASCVQGLSNIAAGATIGSNHNSRAPDGEIRAGRGFWPGLCVSLKHSSRFGSYVLLSKGSYPAELNIQLPFSLVNNNTARDCLEIIPAWFWMYNMYALERNAWKAQARDARKIKVQRIESQYLAPDTAEEIWQAMELLQLWTAKAAVHEGLLQLETEDCDSLIQAGQRLLEEADNRTVDTELLADGLENSKRPVIILKPRRSWRAYRHMLRYYAVQTLLDALDGLTSPEAIDARLAQMAQGERQKGWVNMGGQIVSERQSEQLKKEIRGGHHEDWQSIHRAYDEMAMEYGSERLEHASCTLRDLYGVPVSSKLLLDELALALETRRWIGLQVYTSRAKDHDNEFRKSTYRNQAEMDAVLGRPEENSFVHSASEATRDFEKQVARIMAMFGREAN
jgi:hypothetical protein